jgi:hypothetical protein
VDAITRRELFRRIGRAAIAGPIILATREEQSILLYRLERFFGSRSMIGRWFSELWTWW